MALPHGFRIYRMQAWDTKIKDTSPEFVSAGSWAHAHILEALTRLSASGTQYLAPRHTAADEPPPATTSVTVGEPVVVGPDIIHLEVSIGELGHHRKAVRPGKNPRALDKWSAEADYYVTLLFSDNTDEDRFVAVAHSIRRRDAMPELQQLLTRMSMEMRQETAALEKARRASSKAEGGTPPAPQRHKRLLFRRFQAADSNYVAEIIASARDAKAVFTERVPTGRGRGGEAVVRSLSITLLDEKGKDIGRKVARAWTRTRDRADGSRLAGVSDLGAELESSGLMSEGEYEAYNAAAISVTGQSGARTSIAIDTLQEVFTYPVSEGRPQAFYYYQKVSGRLATVAAEAGIAVRKIEPLEVEQCLTGSTSAPSPGASGTA